MENRTGILAMDRRSSFGRKTSKATPPRPIAVPPIVVAGVVVLTVSVSSWRRDVA